MVRKAIQLLVLPLLFTLLSAGGNATLCEVLSVVGLEVHHHPHDVVYDHPGALCFETHDHGHEEIPCPESCEIQLSEAPAPILLKVPDVSEGLMLPFLLEALLSVHSPDTAFEAFDKLEPPDLADSLTDPTFTGRFLV